MSAVAEKRFAFGLPGRIQAPNSKPRSIAVVGLGEGGAAIARALSKDPQANVEVHVLAKSASSDAIAAIKAGGGDLHRDLMNAAVVARIAHSRNHPVTALYIVPADAPAANAEDETLKTLRTAVEMLVVVSDESYVPAMIAALAV